jgi:hypothetical protein
MNAPDHAAYVTAITYWNQPISSIARQTVGYSSQEAAIALDFATRRGELRQRNAHPQAFFPARANCNPSKAGDLCGFSLIWRQLLIL